MTLLSFWDHVDELRKTLIRVGLSVFFGTISAFLFREKLLALLLAPFDEPFYLFSPIEGFLVVLKLSFWAGLTLSSPLWLYFTLRFILPALRNAEKRLLTPFLLLSTLFIGGGVALAYEVTLPIVIRFFREFNNGIAENLWSLSQSLNFALMLIVAHGIIFELYVGLLFFIHFGLLSSQNLKSARRAMIVVIFLIAAILTPPDLLSQVLLALPMLLMFELSIVYACYLERKVLQ